MCDKQTMIKCRVEQYSLRIAKYIDLIENHENTGPLAIAIIGYDSSYSMFPM